MENIAVILDPAGMEALAKGQKVYSWHYTVKALPDIKPTDYILGEITPIAPVRETCIVSALAAIAKRRTEINLLAASDLQELKDRENALLMLGAPE